MVESLYRYSSRVTRRTGSSAVRAACWDQRPGALGSLAVLVGLMLARWAGAVGSSAAGSIGLTGSAGHHETVDAQDGVTALRFDRHLRMSLCDLMACNLHGVVPHAAHCDGRERSVSTEHDQRCPGPARITDNECAWTR
jgi:hypothetical protein